MITSPPGPHRPNLSILLPQAPFHDRHPTTTNTQVANGDHVYLRYAVPEALHGYRVVGALVVVQAHDQGCVLTHAYACMHACMQAPGLPMSQPTARLI